MQRKRARIMIVVISALIAVLLLVGLIIYPPSKGDIPQFYNEHGEITEHYRKQKLKEKY